MRVMDIMWIRIAGLLDKLGVVDRLILHVGRTKLGHNHLVIYLSRSIFIWPCIFTDLHNHVWFASTKHRCRTRCSGTASAAPTFSEESYVSKRFCNWKDACA